MVKTILGRECLMAGKQMQESRLFVVGHTSQRSSGMLRHDERGRWRYIVK